MIRGNQQQGFTLLIGLIMLIMMTLFAVAAFDLGKASLQIVGNMQQRGQVLGAAQAAIEEVISKTDFFQTPSAVFIAPCAGANTKCYDVNGSGKKDIVVALNPAPFCSKAKTIKNASLKLSNPDDLGCAIGVAQTFGIEGSVTGDSLCSDSLWEVRAVASDAVTQASATITQGVAVRVSTDNIATSCP